MKDLLFAIKPEGAYSILSIRYGTRDFNLFQVCAAVQSALIHSDIESLPFGLLHHDEVLAIIGLSNLFEVTDKRMLCAPPLPLRYGVAISIAIQLFCGQEDTAKGQNDICGDAGQILPRGCARVAPA